MQVSDLDGFAVGSDGLWLRALDALAWLKACRVNSHPVVAVQLEATVNVDFARHDLVRLTDAILVLVADAHQPAVLEPGSLDVFAVNGLD